MAEVVLENVSKVYPGGVRAVRDLSMRIEDREFVVLVGPSGCGKTTTLRMVAGLEEVTEGTVYIGDRRVNDVPPKDRDIAMVFQNYALYPHMTVYDNLAFPLRMRRQKVIPRFTISERALRNTPLYYPLRLVSLGVRPLRTWLKDNRGRVDPRIEEATRMLGLGQFLDRKPKELSGGQRQRVAVGRAIVRHPKAFLFDEPLSNLDAKLRVEMRAELKKLHTRLQSTMIYVTHDQVEAMTLGDRIAVMNEGVVQQYDEPLTVYERPVNRFVAQFIGTPPMNFMAGRIEMEDGSAQFAGAGVRLRLPERFRGAVAPYAQADVWLGIRPEDVHDCRDVPDADPQSVIRARVNVVEPLGNEQLLHLSAGRASLIVRMHTRRHVRVEDELELALDMGRGHVFDAESGINVTLGAAD